MKVMVSYRFDSEFGKLQRKIEKTNIAYLYNFGQRTRNQARGLVGRSPTKKPRPAGKPWGFGSGWLRDSIVFNVDRLNDDVEVGFFRGVHSSELHEFGGRVVVNRRGKRQVRIYPARPVMVPAFERAKNALANNEKYAVMYRKLFERR